MTQGRCDWLGLHRTTLAFATPHRFIPALLPLLHNPRGHDPKFARVDHTPLNVGQHALVTTMYAKNTGRLQERLDVYWIVHNFVRVHFTTRQVPAVALGILDHGFALHELFLIQKAA